MRYKKGDFCIIKKSSKFVEGSIVKLAMPYHGSSYYKEGDIRYFVTEKRKVKSPSFGIINKNDMIKTYSESELISWEREWKINQLL
jgi:hypothetical protein